MERKFIYPVAMPCNDEQFQFELKGRLRELGYKVDAQFFSRDLISNVWNGTFKIALINQCDAGIDARHLIPYNPKLFLALAAMSEGDEFWPGECVVCLWKGSSRFHEEKLYKVTGVDEWGRLWSTDEYGAPNWMYLYPTEGAKEPNFRKATAEEIIAHFSKEERVQVDSVIGKVSVEKSFFDQISGETDTPDVPLSEKVDKMVNELTEISDHADDVLKKAEAFADKIKISKALTDDCVPQPFEPIWVWNNGSDKIRHKMLFAFFSEETVFAFEETYATWSNFQVHEWQNWAKIDAPVEVPKEDIVKYFAKAYNVPTGLIKIAE